MDKEIRYLVDGVWTKVRPDDFLKIEGIETREYLTKEELVKRFNKFEI